MIVFIPDPGFDERALGAVVALGEAIGRTIGIARLLIERGRIVDLTGLDQGVGLLCAKALDLPPESGRKMRPRLTALLSDFDNMTLTLHRHAVTN